MAAAERTYLDHNATSPLRPEAAAAMARALALPGNPSSVHAEGRAARAAIEAARDAGRGAGRRRGRGTSSSPAAATEANNTVLSPACAARRAAGATRSSSARPSTRACSTATGSRPTAVERIPVDRRRRRRPRLARRRGLGRGRPAGSLVSVQLANNETGVIQPVAEAARLVHAPRRPAPRRRRPGGRARLPVDIAALGVDALTPVGPQARRAEGRRRPRARVRPGRARRPPDPRRRPGARRPGRHRERRRHRRLRRRRRGRRGRASTAEPARLAALRDEAERGLRAAAPARSVFGAGAERLPNTLAFAVPGVRAETALIAFDLAGVAVSSGSACSSGKVRRSHVLDAMGVEPALARGGPAREPRVDFDRGGRDPLRGHVRKGGRHPI